MSYASERDTCRTMPDESTTPEVANIKRAYAAFNRRAWDAFFVEVDPEFEFDPVEENVTYRGRQAVIEYFGLWLEAWEEFQIEPEHIDVAPATGRMLSVMHYRARNPASEVPIEGRFFHVIEWREGKPWRVKSYADEADARAAF